MLQERSESAQEQRIVLYKKAINHSVNLSTYINKKVKYLFLDQWVANFDIGAYVCTVCF